MGNPKYGPVSSLLVVGSELIHWNFVSSVHIGFKGQFELRIRIGIRCIRNRLCNWVKCTDQLK